MMVISRVLCLWFPPPVSELLPPHSCFAVLLPRSTHPPRSYFYLPFITAFIAFLFEAPGASSRFA